MHYKGKRGKDVVTEAGESPWSGLLLLSVHCKGGAFSPGPTVAVELMAYTVWVCQQMVWLSGLICPN